MSMTSWATIQFSPRRRIRSYTVITKNSVSTMTEHTASPWQIMMKRFIISEKSFILAGRWNRAENELVTAELEVASTLAHPFRTVLRT